VPDMRDEELGGVEEPLPTELDCTLGVISHLLYVIPVLGILAVAVLWQWRGRESRFMGYQAKQAAVFQAVVLGAMVVGALVLTILGFVPVVGALFRVVRPLTVVVIWLGGLALAVYAAVRVHAGANYKYPVVSDYLGD